LLSSVPGDAAVKALALPVSAASAAAPSTLFLAEDTAFAVRGDDDDDDDEAAAAAAAAAAALGLCALDDADEALNGREGDSMALAPSMLCESLCSGRLLPSSRLISSKTESRSRWMLDVELV
jgi:hypothetical protein